MRNTIIFVMLLGLAGAAGAQLDTPPPGSVGVFFDPYMQENYLWIDGSYVFIPLYVLAYDLPDSVAAYRFSLVSSAQPSFLGLSYPPGIVNTGTGSNFVLEAQGDCVGGTGLVTLATGVLLPFAPVYDATLCLGTVEIRRCGADTWEPLTPLYPGCAYVNPYNSNPPYIPHNNPNAAVITANDTSGEPTDIATMTIGVKDILKSAGDPMDLARVTLRLTWDPLVATYGGVTSRAPSGWTVSPSSGPGWLQLTMQGAAGFDPWFSGHNLADVRFVMGGHESACPVTLTIDEMLDEALQPIAGTPPDSLTLAVTCVKGDVLSNGNVNAMDALLALRFAAQIEMPDLKEFCRADVNGNDEIDAGDGAAILTRAVRLPRKASPKLEVARTAEGLRVDVGDAAGCDLTVTWDPNLGELLDWVAEPAFAGAERREPGLLQLALARANAEPAAIDLHFSDAGMPLAVARARTWGGEGEPLAALDDLTVTAVPAVAQTVRLLAPRPNPFNPSTAIRFVMPTAGRASISVMDAQGRRVWRSIVVAATAGMNEVAWRGVDDGGRALASGVYLVEVETDFGRATTRAVLVR